LETKWPAATHGGVDAGPWIRFVVARDRQTESGHLEGVIRSDSSLDPCNGVGLRTVDVRIRWARLETLRSCRRLVYGNQSGSLHTTAVSLLK